MRNTHDVHKHYKATLEKWWLDHPEKRSEFAKRQFSNPARRLKQSAIAKAYLHNDESQKKSLLKRMQHPRMMACAEHHTAKIWRLRDPKGIIHEFRNLNNFIRENPHLFLPEDVAWYKHKRVVRCRASALRNLHPDRKEPFATWKGWTWVSIQERINNEGFDLLDRMES